jgi:hypothetical protein
VGAATCSVPEGEMKEIVEVWRTSAFVFVARTCAGGA